MALHPIPTFEAVETGSVRAARRELAADGENGAVLALSILKGAVARGVDRGYLFEVDVTKGVDTASTEG